MSYALVVYSVPLDELRAVPGSRDKKLLRAIEKKEARFFADIDRLFEENAEEGESPATCRGALAQIINGEPLEGRDSAYIFAFEGVCSYLGAYLDNRAFQPPIHWEWIDTVDRFLAGVGFPLKVADLAAGDCPIDIPPGAIPSRGWWPPANLPQALDLLTSLRLDGLEIDMAEALATIIGWLDAAVRRDGHCLVGIYC